MSLNQTDQSRRWYPTPPGLRDDLHARFLNCVSRATLAAALPDELMAEPVDDEEVDLEGEAAPEDDTGEGVGGGRGDR